MLGAARWTVVAALLTGCLLLPAAVYAIVPEVRDQGKFFDAATIKKANEILIKIQERYKKDVVVETFASIPDEVLKKHAYDEKNRKAFFAKWAADVATSGKINGVLILICKDQKHD